MVCDLEVIDSIIRVNCTNCMFGSSLEDFDACFARTIDKILEVKKVERIVLAGAMEHEYDFEQTKLLIEIAEAYDKLINVYDILEYSKLGAERCERCFPKRFAELKFLLTEMLRKDPIGAYVMVKRMIRHNSSIAGRENVVCQRCYNFYIKNALLPIKETLENTTLIRMVKDKLHGYRISDRTLYRDLFHPLVRPAFMLTRYETMPPEGGRPLERYSLPNGMFVEIYKVPGKVRNYYHISVPEFRLSDEKYSILDAARRQLAEYKPSEREFTHPEMARETFMNMGRDILSKLSRESGLHLSDKELNELANILARYTAGFGILEVLLADEKIQDIYINSPIGTLPIYILHDDWEECETNLIPTREDAEGWATRFRLFSGRPLDEANPVLDTELFVPGAKARVCAITSTLSPEGIGYALRRHRERPWTYPLFMNVKFFDPLFAGLMSFLVSGARTLLIAGGRSSGKTSLLSSTILEIMKKFRVVTVEDSVASDCEIIFERDGKFEREEIGKLIDKMIEMYGCEVIDGREILRRNPEHIKVFSVNSEEKVRLSLVKSFIRHKIKKQIFEIETKTGKKIKVTGDHSLFTLGKNGLITPVKVKNLKVGDYLTTPRKLPLSEKNNIKSINLLDHLDKFGETFIFGSPIEKIIRKYRGKIKEIAIRAGYSKSKPDNYPKSAIRYWKKRNTLPWKILCELIKENNTRMGSKELRIKVDGNSKSIPIEIYLDENFLTFIGLWLADGCYDRSNVIISVVDEDSRDVVHKIGKRFGINVRMHSDRVSFMLGSKILRMIMEKVLDLKGDAYTKRIPKWCFSLSKNQIAHLLKGVFSGDGYISKYEVAISLTSLNMIKDVQTLLLSFGIISRINKMNEKDKTYSCRISGLKNLKPFFKKIGFLQKSFMNELERICKKNITHDNTDIIPFSVEFKEGLTSVFSKFNKHDYVTRGFNLGREKLKNLLNRASCDGGEIIEKLETLANSDIFWDEIRDIKVSEKECYVYDISVEEDENFICENILAHNTLEIPIAQLRNLGYNVERLKSRSVITRVEREMPADEALRTAIRLGDACLIVGEVRSTEASALYEAMRIGALSNVVMGTIHGESAYGVFDRVVNDLKVPPTSFKATDIIVICGKLRTADGLHTFRRVLDVTEVRKQWKEDPLEEGGFVNLMEYSAKEDKLKPTETLINGESLIINEIAKRVKEWHGNWDAIWNNIELRGKIKQTIVDYAKKLNRPELLEAEFTLRGNEAFHLIADEVRGEVGELDSEEIYRRWLEWFKKELRS